eukprot:1055930-Amphidinium_carterae.1
MLLFLWLPLTAGISVPHDKIHSSAVLASVAIAAHVHALRSHLWIVPLLIFTTGQKGRRKLSHSLLGKTWSHCRTCMSEVTG